MLVKQLAKCCAARRCHLVIIVSVSNFQEMILHMISYYKFGYLPIAVCTTLRRCAFNHTAFATSETSLRLGSSTIDHAFHHVRSNDHRLGRCIHLRMMYFECRHFSISTSTRPGRHGRSHAITFQVMISRMLLRAPACSILAITFYLAFLSLILFLSSVMSIAWRHK